jgi:N-methylhydantoinase A
MSLRDAAAGIVEIANQHMSDLMRKMTIERGYDPRDFVVYAFGGAGPLHGGAFGRELGVQEIIYPLGNIASAFSAFGLAVSDLQTVTQISDLALAPFDPDRVNDLFTQLEEEALAQLAGGGNARDNVTLQRIFELRYKGQVHEVDTPVPGGRLDTAALERVIDDFERRYQTLYGRGSGFREAGVELVTYRVLGSTRVQDAEIGERCAADGAPAPIPTTERLYWRELGVEVETAIYRGAVAPGTSFDGPAVIRLESTTALVHPGQRATVDGFGNIRIATGRK